LATQLSSLNKGMHHLKVDSKRDYCQTKMTEFLGLHARDSDFTETIIKARKLAEAEGNHRIKKTDSIVKDKSQKTNQVNAFDTSKAKSGNTLEGFEKHMQNAIKPQQKSSEPATEYQLQVSESATETWGK